MAGHHKVAPEQELTGNQAIELLLADSRLYPPHIANANINVNRRLVETGKVEKFSITTKGLDAVKTSHGWATARVYIARPELAEFTKGFYRIRPTSRKSSSGLVIYSVQSQDDNVIYIFKLSEIAGIGSLSLRFSKTPRDSRYGFAIDRWNAL